MKPLIFCLLAVSIATLLIGDANWNLVWEGVLNRISGDSQKWNPLLDERLPRLIVLLGSGAALAVAGAVMQSLFHNPLASPSVLGISAGGSIAVISVFAFGLHLAYPYAIPVAAIAGSMATLLLIYTLARREGLITLHGLILTGIALSTVLIASQSTLIYALRERWQLIQTVSEWEAGSAIGRSWEHVNLQLPLIIVGLTGCIAYSREVNILALGEEEAMNLGVDVATVRWRLFLCVALLTGGALAATGFVPFFGLILPHLIRTLKGPDNRRLIPLCIIGGSTALAAMDLSLRIFKIHLLSVGNLSAILGGFIFLYLLLRNQRFQVAEC